MSKISALFFISIIIVNSGCFTPKANFEGIWTYQGDSSYFTLFLKQKNNKLTGSYCAVSQKGTRIDCRLDSSDTSFESQKIKRSSITTVRFTSYYMNSVGKAKIEKLNNEKINWTIIDKPKLEFYTPIIATLTKEKR